MAEKFHNRLSVDWRPMDAGSMAQSKFKGFRTREATGSTLSSRLKSCETGEGAPDISSGFQRLEGLDFCCPRQETSLSQASGKETHLLSVFVLPGRLGSAHQH